MDNRKKEKLRNLINGAKNPNAVIIDELERMNDNLIKVLEKNGDDRLMTILEAISLIKGDKGDKGDTGDKGSKPVAGVDYFTEKEIIKFKQEITPIKGVDYFDGEDGKTPIKGVDYYTETEIEAIAKQILIKATPVKGVDYKDGEKGEKGEDGKAGRPPKHEIKGNSIRFENPDGTWGEWIHLGELLGGQKSIHRGGTMFKREDLTSQCDGSNKTFTLDSNYETNSVALYGTQFPTIYRPVIDFTESGSKTITLTSEVSAPESGQTLIATYVKI